jgi:alkanesulfonate monooxygenase SsuD/methylene tetrahydromethanopterin reductase-like flavin-dependent oxidoreductase (luciferase family)
LPDFSGGRDQLHARDGIDDDHQPSGRARTSSACQDADYDGDTFAGPCDRGRRARFTPGRLEAAGIEFDERWPRFDEAIRALRHLLGAASEPYSGHFYRTDGLDLEPKPKADQRVPIWIGSWGSDIGLKRVARYADGWLASAYNTDPVTFADSRRRLDEYLTVSGRSAGSLPNAIATMFFHLTESRAEAERVVRIVAAFLNRSEDLIRDRLLIGSWEKAAAKIIAFRDAGAQALLVWPVEDDLKQLEKFRSRFMTAPV